MLRRATTCLGRILHQAFEASLAIKGLMAAAEGLAGIGLLLTSNAALLAYVNWLTRHEIAQDPTDPIALWVQGAAGALSIETQHFYALYLIAHGALKLTMVLALAKRAVWAYPVSVLILACFVAYQLQHWTHTHSDLLLLLSGFDFVMILLILREYTQLRRQRPGV